MTLDSLQCLFEVMILCGIGDNILWYQRSCFVVLVMIFCGVDDDIDPGCRDARVWDFWGKCRAQFTKVTNYKCKSCTFGQTWMSNLI